MSLLPIKEVRENDDLLDSKFEFTHMINFFGQSDTFLKLCLLNSLIQQELMTIVIERMVMLAQASGSSSSNSNRDGGTGIQADSAHPAMKLLNHLRWCDVIYDPKQLIERLMEPLSILPKPFQIEIISSLPSLTSEKDSHDELVRQLQEIMESFPELAPCVLECVSSLCLAPDCHSLRNMVSLYMYVCMYVCTFVCMYVCVCRCILVSYYSFVSMILSTHPPTHLLLHRFDMLEI